MLPALLYSVSEQKVLQLVSESDTNWKCRDLSDAWNKMPHK